MQSHCDGEIDGVSTHPLAWSSAQEASDWLMSTQISPLLFSGPYFLQSVS